MDRRELRLKILGKYGSLGKFSEDMGYSRQQISNILACKDTGGLEFWKLAKEKLNLTPQETWEYQIAKKKLAKNKEAEQPAK